MKQIVRYLVGIVGALCVWVMMFGFDHDGQTINLMSSQVYADSVANGICDGAGDTIDCESLCKDNNKTGGCDVYLDAKKAGNLTDLANTLDQFLTFLYLIMRPLLYVAGLAMDNTLIYGESLGITGLLYQFWSIMRTMANFTIVFILVWTIGEQMRKGKQGAKELGKTLLAILLSGVLINASWFIIGAMVDVSTIATYGVGTLPLTLQSENKNCEEKVTSIDGIKKLGTCRPIIATHSTLNFADTLNPANARYKSYYSYTPAAGKGDKQYFLSCVFKFGVVNGTEWDTFVSNFEKARLNNNQRESGGETGTVIEMPKGSTINKEYCVLNSNDLFEMTGSSGAVVGSDPFNNKIVAGVEKLRGWGGQTIRTMVDAQQGMIGVMYSMYGNMLGFANIKSSAGTFTTEGSIVQFMIKGFFGLAIMFPLIALCIVLVMRIAYLWIIVGFSPLLVIGRTLEKMGIKNDHIKSMMEGIGKDITLGNVVSLLLQPVLVVFVMSLGMMFLDALQSSMLDGSNFGTALQCDPAQKCCSVIETFNICFEKVNIQSGNDTFFHYFTGSIVNVIGVMLLYFMTFAVIKSNGITKKVGQQIQDFGTNYMGSIPIIPWRDSQGRFGGESVGVMGAKKGLTDSWETITKPTEDTTGDTVVKPPIQKFFESATGKVSGAGQKVSKALEGVDLSKIKDDVSVRQDVGKKIIGAIDEAKKDLKYTSANQFVNESDSNIKKLFESYDVKNLTELLAHPKFIAETGNSSSKLVESLQVDKGWSKANDNIKAKYLETLNNKKDIITTINATTGYVEGADGKRYLVDYTKDAKDQITAINSSETKFTKRDGDNYEGFANLSGKLTETELETAAGGGLTKIDSNKGRTIATDADKKITITKNPEPTPPA